MKVIVGLCPTSLSPVPWERGVHNGLGLRWCPTPCKSGFIWISPLRTRQAVSCIIPICTVPMQWVYHQNPDVNTTTNNDHKQTKTLHTILLFNVGCWVADSVSVWWTGLRHWGLLSCDPRGFSTVHLLAAHRTVILKRDDERERDCETENKLWMCRGRGL